MKEPLYKIDTWYINTVGIRKVVVGVHPSMDCLALSSGNQDITWITLITFIQKWKEEI